MSAIKAAFLNHTFWKDKRVVVTGGKGFVGSRVVSRVAQLGPKDIRVTDHAVHDLRTYKDCVAVCTGADIVVHLAGNVGGIEYNRSYPATIFHDNVLMGVYMHQAAYACNVSKFVSIGSVCAYPKFAPIPFREDDVWNGYPEETNAAYGLAKKTLLVLSQAYRQQYGMNAIHLLPTNIYGPGDSFDPFSSHVIPALIRLFDSAMQQHSTSVTVWGTGKATRDFLYVEDAAEAILCAAELYNDSKPVNLGSGNEISIRELAETVAEHMGYTGIIRFDTGKPDGQPRRRLDTTRAQKQFGFTATTSFYTGIEHTISWYRNHHNF